MPESLAPASAGPIFVLGTGRSGTTLVQRLVNSHSEVNVWGEHGGFLSFIAEAYFMHYENDVITTHAFAGDDVAQQISRLKNPEQWQGWINWYTQRDVAALFRRFIESFFKPESLAAEARWGFKEIRYGAPECRVVEMLAELYPDARFIVIVREPVDVIASQIAAWDAARSVPLETRARRWLRDYQSYARFVTAHPSQALLIRYEDLTSRPTEILQRLTAFLGLTYTDKERVLLLEGGRGTTRDRPGAPRSFLSEDDVRTIREITEELAASFGYS